MKDLRGYNQMNMDSIRYQLPNFIDKDKVLKVFDEVIASRIRDTDFEEMYKEGGRPPVSPRLLAILTLLQVMEKLPDRQAMRNLTNRIDWKYILDLPLEHEGFSFQLLNKFRNRLLESGKARLVFDKILEELKERELIKAKGYQRLDSTCVLADIKSLTRVELICETLRLSCEDILENINRIKDFKISRICNQYIDPVRIYGKSQDERDAMLKQAGKDMQVLSEFVSRIDKLKDLESSKTLIQVFDQNFEIKDQKIKLIEKATGKDHICSPHDPEARFGSKHKKIGYKAQVTESLDEKGKPGYITDIEVENLANSDSGKAEEAIKRLEEKDLKPKKIYTDSGYSSGTSIKNCEQEEVGLHAPVKGKGNSVELNPEETEASCQAGKKSERVRKEANGRITAFFKREDCLNCPFKEECKSKINRKSGKRIRFQKDYSYIQSRREEQKTPEFKQEMMRRNSLEGTISALKRAYGMMRARYRGMEKTALQFYFSAACFNIKRLSFAFAQVNA